MKCGVCKSESFERVCNTDGKFVIDTLRYWVEGPTFWVCCECGTIRIDQETLNDIKGK